MLKTNCQVYFIHWSVLYRVYSEYNIFSSSNFITFENLTFTIISTDFFKTVDQSYYLEVIIPFTNTSSVLLFFFILCVMSVLVLCWYVFVFIYSILIVNHKVTIHQKVVLDFLLSVVSLIILGIRCSCEIKLGTKE